MATFEFNMLTWRGDERKLACSAFSASTGWDFQVGGIFGATVTCVDDEDVKAACREFLNGLARKGHISGITLVEPKALAQGWLIKVGDLDYRHFYLLFGPRNETEAYAQWRMSTTSEWLLNEDYTVVPYTLYEGVNDIDL